MSIGRSLASALLLTLMEVSLCISNAQEQSPHCFSIHLAHDDDTVDGPHAITLLDKTRNLTVEESQGKFCIPNEMTTKPALDMSFIVGDDRFYLTRIPMERFEALWDISYGEKKYWHRTGLPRSKATKVCTVEFHQGEPETGMITSPCRFPASTPLK